jgi:glycosyltransferase involved in cell wall biosynthesis
MLDIIIPCHNSHETLDRCIASIIMQTAVKDCKVSLINDGGKDYSEIIQRYSPILSIQELSYSEQGGPTKARNFGIENTSEEYLMFIDSDDTLSSPYVAEKFCQKFNESPEIAYIISGINIEKPEGNLRECKQNKSWMHGKCYRRSFLDYYKIRSNPDSNCCEDAGFNLLCLLLTDKDNFKEYLMPYTTYNWMYNRNSIGRKDEETWEHRDVIIGTVDNMIYTYTELEKRNVSTGRIFLEKVISMLHVILMYLTNIQKHPEFKMENEIALIRLYKTVYKPIKERVTEKILDFACNTFEVLKDENNRELTLEILKKLQEIV